MNYKSLNSGVLVMCIMACFSIETQAQKVKYKDLYVLLSANDFKQAEPFLRKFMEQKDDHPNATMFMGRLYEYKLTQSDILKNTDEYISYADSAIIFYRKAFNLIDEKEIKRNDEYYQDYARRDLRSGKYGVKLADVKFDLEKKIDGLESASNNVKRMKTHFDLLVSSYEEVISLYNGLVDNFPDLPHLLLTSDESVLDTLRLIEKSYNQFSSSFDSYKTELTNFSKSGYRQKLNVTDVATLSQLTVPDFYENKIDVYELKSWSMVISAIISDEIAPLKSNMSAYDQQLDDLLSQIKEDSLVVEDQLINMKEGLSFDQLKNYDSDPLPTGIFTFKEEEINYYSLLNQKSLDGHLDSADIDFQLKVFKLLQDLHTPMEESYIDLAKVDIYQKSTLYPDFINERYSNINGVSSYISLKGIEVENERSRLEDKINYLNEASIWAVWGNDSIPLYVTDSVWFHPDSTQFTYHTLDTDTTSGGFVTTGMRYNHENIEIYTASIGRDRMVDTLFMKPLESPILPASISVMSGWLETYSKGGDDQFTGIIQLVHLRANAQSNYEISQVIPATGIQWSSTFKNDKNLFEFNVDAKIGLIVIRLKADGEEGEEESLVFNFDGALLSSNDDK